ncbi:Hypothetical predicted protein [Paramuricea clavata]|uniref:Uncharacterized protein n=1 Tax=Paramuricea clavata TaxID=317549 RepID=A0A6S7IWA3_PARCT|nr:Hypothetical predicted protein [Paramuricea clavata]
MNRRSENGMQKSLQTLDLQSQLLTLLSISPVAKDALVLMAVCVNSSWKIPCGYFFVDGLSGSERANLVKTCIKKLNDVGVDVVSLTCDGPSCHFAMLKALGACLEPGTLQPYFSHPMDPKKNVARHLSYVGENTLGEKHILIDKDGEKICWDYTVALEKLQNKEGLRLDNKLKLAHIKWWQQKMKVNLAAQVFSSSVANAIEYCNKELKLPQFQGSEATVKLIKLFDGLFDILNSRNPCAKGYKAPLLVANKSVWDPYLDNAYNYILGLKSADGQLMHTTRRKTGFIGFLAAVKSIKAGQFHELVERAEAPMKYLFSYKFSQDHLELFFVQSDQQEASTTTQPPGSLHQHISACS